MEAPNDFATLLRAHMARALRTNHDLARLTGIALRTIENWTAGEVRRPRAAVDVLKLARALALDGPDADAMLRAANHPSLAVLRTQTGDAQLQELLTAWDATLQTAAPTALAPGSKPSNSPKPGSALRHQLRPPVADFVGREAEAGRLTAVLQAALECGSGAVISGLHGMGGIGKTELAYLLAHHLCPALPDAQIVLNLRGSGTAPLSPAQTLQMVLRALDPELALVADLETLQARYRSALHGQRALLIADDAADAAQVYPLLPPQGCVLLVTSRVRFTLPGMLAVNLEVLAEDEAVALLRTLCERLSEADAHDLARACGSLPLALRVSGSILQVNPALSPAGYIRQLADERQRLAQLRDPDDPHLDVAASLTLSYARLDATAQVVFRQLGVFVAPFSTELAQQAVVVPGGEDVVPELHGLLRRNLVMYDAERERWRLHDLVRDLARQQLEAAGEAKMVLWRYTRAVVAQAEHIQDQYLAGTTTVAVAQFDVERAHIDATHRWAQTQVETPDGDQLLIDIAMATRHIGLLRYDPRQERFPLWEAVRAAAKRLDNLLVEGCALSNLGIASYNLGEIQQAVAYYEQRLTIARTLGDRRGEGAALGNLGLAASVLGESSKAIEYHRQSLAINRERNDRRYEAIDLNWLGFAYTLHGEPHIAMSCYDQALPITRELGDQQNEGLTLIYMGNAATDLGDARQGIAYCRAGLVQLRALGARREEGYALSYLARALAIQGNLTEAEATFEQALALFEKVDECWGAVECQWFYGIALAQWGLWERALPLLRATLDYKCKIGHAQYMEHAAVVARLEVGELLTGRLMEQGLPGQSREKVEMRKMPPVNVSSTDKKQPNSECTGT